ncbi:hypothetical protein IV203_010190 [Nitzschia inconspicua]|uniref:Uncharacterized protein n=1 Tax=Nitzschia inconspicua TaxID=303405 RepID=A0A9K3PKK4_9STRA|nr:hypothetical protein IV203_010190 [Nitzschia inconspicua]
MHVTSCSVPLLNYGRYGTLTRYDEEEFGLHLTRRQVAQMQQMAKLADDLNNTDELEQYKHLDSDTDRVLAYLKKKGATYCALYHGVRGTSAELVLQTQEKLKHKLELLTWLIWDN